MAPPKSHTPPTSSSTTTSSPTIAKTTTTSSYSQTLNTPTTPLQTPFSKTYVHIHAPLLLSIYAASFTSLVASPASTGLYLLIPLTILQGLYCALCLPPHGSSSSTNATTPRRKPSVKGHDSPWSKALPAILSILLSLTLPPAPLYVLLVCHGAPLGSHLAHTGVLALHLSLLASVPVFYVHGMGGATWCRFISLCGPAQSGESDAGRNGAKEKDANAARTEAGAETKMGLILDTISAQALGTLLGAWVGAIPIPLDWDREWQAWPVTVLTGAWVGAIVGQVLGGAVAGRGWRVGFGA